MTLPRNNSYSIYLRHDYKANCAYMDGHVGHDIKMNEDINVVPYRYCPSWGYMDKSHGMASFEELFPELL